MSPQQQQIESFRSSGMAIIDIAAKMGIAVSTVRNCTRAAQTVPALRDAAGLPACQRRPALRRCLGPCGKLRHSTWEGDRICERCKK